MHRMSQPHFSFQNATRIAPLGNGNTQVATGNLFVPVPAMGELLLRTAE
jgi:uncharacterized protein (DUF111 family)